MTRPSLYIFDRSPDDSMECYTLHQQIVVRMTQFRAYITDFGPDNSTEITTTTNDFDRVYILDRSTDGSLIYITNRRQDSNLGRDLNIGPQGTNRSVESRRSPYCQKLFEL